MHVEWNTWELALVWCSRCCNVDFSKVKSIIANLQCQLQDLFCDKGAQHVCNHVGHHYKGL